MQGRAKQIQQIHPIPLKTLHTKKLKVIKPIPPPPPPEDALIKLDKIEARLHAIGNRITVLNNMCENINAGMMRLLTGVDYFLIDQFSFKNDPNYALTVHVPLGVHRMYTKSNIITVSLRLHTKAETGYSMEEYIGEAEYPTKLKQIFDFVGDGKKTENTLELIFNNFLIGDYKIKGELIIKVEPFFLHQKNNSLEILHT